MIRLRGIRRSYTLGGGTIHALDGVDETIERGEHVAIMGPSGSGKSTLLNIIGCLDRPTEGSYELSGREVSGLSELELAAVRRRQVGYVFQTFHLIARLDAVNNVELGMLFDGVARRERRQRALAALEQVGLAARAGHRPAELSGGERQRVAIARAIVMRPDVLLADEPTGNLDRGSGGVVLDLLDTLHARGLTLLVVTHDPDVARRAQRVIILRDGKIVRRLAAAELTSLADALAGREVHA
jgi:putative ABC transport system ATP-binding protein